MTDMSCDEIGNHIITEGCGTPEQPKGMWHCIRCRLEFITLLDHETQMEEAGPGEPLDWTELD